MRRTTRGHGRHLGSACLGMVGGLLRIGEASNPGPEMTPGEEDDTPEGESEPDQGHGQESPCFRVDSVNITAWGVAPKQANEEEALGRGSAAVLCHEAPPIQLIQEHRLATNDDIRRAAGEARAAGFRLQVQRASRTEKDGVSGGVGILVHKGISAGPLPHKGPHADRWAPYKVAGTWGTGSSW